MIIAAVSDIHSPRYFPEFLRALDGLDALEKKPQLMLIAGDMVNRGGAEEYERVYNAMFGKVTCPIVACFGNNEYQEIRDKLKARFRNVSFLDDQSTTVALRVPGSPRDLVVGIIGTTGSLENPTPWQRANVPGIERIYADRVAFVERQLITMRADYRIVLMHYAPTYRTLEGENPSFYGSMGWNVYENVFIRHKPDLVIHGHSHAGSRHAWIESVPVFNASIQVNSGKLLMIDTDTLKPGLTKFVQ